MSNKLGRCDKSQYEHAGLHAEITEHGQSAPPFPCQNWCPSLEPSGKPGLTVAEIEQERDTLKKEVVRLIGLSVANVKLQQQVAQQADTITELRERIKWFEART